MTTQRNINTLALPHAARSRVLALRAWLMTSGMQRSKASGSAAVGAKAGLNFINGPGDQTTRMFEAGARST